MALRSSDGLSLRGTRAITALISAMSACEKAKGVCSLQP
jgi:hypothetical protein